MKVLDPDGSDLGACHEQLITCLHSLFQGPLTSTTMKLKIQFVAVPMAAPFVRMASELISVGYTVNTLSASMRKETRLRPWAEVNLTPGDPLHSNPEEDVI